MQQHPAPFRIARLLVRLSVVCVVAILASGLVRAVWRGINASETPPKPAAAEVSEVVHLKGRVAQLEIERDDLKAQVAELQKQIEELKTVQSEP